MAGTSAFNADVQYLTSLIITTFYLNKDIFCVRSHQMLPIPLTRSATSPSQIQKQLKLNQIATQRSFPTRRMLPFPFVDSGIGVTKNELINNLGTIAKSGSKASWKQWSLVVICP